jgi:hypothetical protein
MELGRFNISSIKGSRTIWEVSEGNMGMLIVRG